MLFNMSLRKGRLINFVIVNRGEKRKTTIFKKKTH